MKIQTAISTAIMLVMLVAIGLALLMPAPAAAASNASPGAAIAAAPLRQAAEPPAVGVVDVLFIATTIAFFKTQLELKGKQVLLAAGVVVLIVGLSVPLKDALPMSTPWVDVVVGLIKLFLFTAGGYDLVTDIGPKALANMAAKPAQ